MAERRKAVLLKRLKVKRAEAMRLAIALLPLIVSEGIALGIADSGVLLTPYIWIAAGAFFCGLSGCFVVLALMKPKADRLRYVIIGFCALILLAVYLVAYHGATSRTVRASRPVAVITWPRAGQHLTSELKVLTSGDEGTLTIKGQARYLPAGSELWLVAYSYQDQTYNVESPVAVPSAGAWHADMSIYFKKRSYSAYELMVVVADSPVIEDILDEDYYSYGLNITYSPPPALINANALCTEDVFIR